MTSNSQSPRASDHASGSESASTPDLRGDLKDLPKEFGVLLLALGVLGLLLPGPIGTPAVVAGGVVLWPGTFGRVSRWMETRFPRFTRAGNRQIYRFIADLERRYPGERPSRPV